MPVIVLVDGLPVAQVSRPVQAVGRGVQHKVKFFGDGAYALQGSSKQGAEIAHRPRSIQAEAFESGLVSARHDPALARHTRRVRAHGDEVTAEFDHAEILLHFLRNNVTENATLLALKVFAGGAQFVEHTTGDECGRGKLRSRMLELLPGTVSVIIIDANIFETPVAFKILNTLRGKQQELFDL